MLTPEVGVAVDPCFCHQFQFQMGKERKVPKVKVIVFPVVMYGCESWTVKKAER